MKSIPKSIILSGSLACLGLLLLVAARNIPWFGEWYAETIYPILVTVVARFFSLFPFSVTEIILYGTVLFFLIGIFIKNIRRHLAVYLLSFAFFLVFLYCANCGVNYYRTPFSQKAGIEVRDSSREELEGLCRFLHARLLELCEDSPDLTITTDRKLLEDSREALYTLSGLYPCLAGYYPAPKLVLISEILSVQQVTGVYAPFTIEANVNRDMVAYNVPFTACHELSHLRGFMREDEANFIAFLACICSDNPVFIKSGLMLGYLYAANALYKENRELWTELSRSLPDRIREEYDENNTFWERYDTPVAELHEAVNDAYLKGHRQTDGVKSYGRVLDLMLAWYRMQV